MEQAIKDLHLHTTHKVRQMMNWLQKHQENRTFAQRIADALAAASGSWWFLILHGIWFWAWVRFKVEPFPFGLLTMIVSLEAIFLSTVILMSQNRQSERDRAQAQQDFETNIAAKEEIEAIMIKLNSIDVEKLDKILRLLEEKQ
ncbi:MAG TPA: DUF1003 domain-containing protein [Candidatus Paceibacterota bacterium]|nr:DUF1003 domain-containing protein [Candidatus Paceibacterota bacterium]